MLEALIRRFKIRPDNGNKNEITPKESSELLSVGLDYLSPKEKSNLLTSSIDIIKRCVPPSYTTSNNLSNTGIVIGKIQSGKTLSFTSVIALARDNGYKLVIIISGRTNLLLKQTKDRVKTVFNGDKKISILNGKLNPERKLKYLTKHLLKPKKGKLGIVTILKHQNHLKEITDLFMSTELSYLLKTNSVLIIDDEADQASLNTYARSNAKKDEVRSSAIFSAIKLLRHSCPNHSYLQYTATPQANLLIDSLSLLSPDWHVLLTPGDSYTGGESFFSENGIKRYASIPIVGDYPPVTKNLDKAPDSYSDSIIEFLMLCALMSGHIEGTEKVNDRGSMLVHPTFFVNETRNSNIGIKRFVDWCVNILESIEADFSDYDLFRAPYEKLKHEMTHDKLFSSFPTLKDVLEVIEQEIIDEITVSQVTGGMLDKEEGYPWEETDYHILIGGALLDRGFTVEDLVVTYMPRDTKSTNQSDTIEQRCRFYGYRKNYIKFCRVYLNSSLIDDFIKYNEFEHFLHTYLSKHTLDEFYSEGSRMLMDKKLIPTNMSRISDPLINTHLTKWQYFEPQHPFIKDNNQLCKGLVSSLENKFQKLIPKDENHQSQPNYLHRVTKCSIAEFINVFTEFKTINQDDEIKQEAILTYLELLIKHDGLEDAWIIDMTPGGSRDRTITNRSNNNESDDYKMSSLLAGDARFGTVDKMEYFGDRTLLLDQDKTRSSILFDYKDEPIIQIHKIKACLKTEDDVPFKGETFSTLALYFPEKYRRNFIQKRKSNAIKS